MLLCSAHKTSALVLLHTYILAHTHTHTHIHTHTSTASHGHTHTYTCTGGVQQVCAALAMDVKAGFGMGPRPGHCGSCTQNARNVSVWMDGGVGLVVGGWMRGGAARRMCVT